MADDKQRKYHLKMTITEALEIIARNDYAEEGSLMFTIIVIRSS